MLPPDEAAVLPLPPALASRPELSPYLEFYWFAFWAISNDRPVGMGAIGAIPFLSIDAYARRHNVTGDHFDRFALLISRMDEVWREEAGRSTPST